MSEITQELRDEIAELAQLQFSDSEIATIVQIDTEELVDLYHLDVDRGRLLAEAEVRRSILDLARKGSTQAQKQFLELNRAAKSGALPRERE